MIKHLSTDFRIFHDNSEKKNLRYVPCVIHYIARHSQHNVLLSYFSNVAASYNSRTFPSVEKRLSISTDKDGKVRELYDAATEMTEMTSLTTFLHHKIGLHLNFRCIFKLDKEQVVENCIRIKFTQFILTSFMR